MHTKPAYPPPRRLKDSKDIERYKSLQESGKFDLNRTETQWRDRSEFLETRGYRLRPRFRKGWKPSWVGTDLHPHNCEDFHRLIGIRIIDAIRISDGKRVVLKRVRRHAREISLAQSLHSEETINDPENHCVPILEYFDDAEDHTLGFLVMPLLRPFDNPGFVFISEVVDFIRQTLIGLRFLHRKKIAHRDLAGLNIMMDGDPLYPAGFHPSHQFLNPVTTAWAEPLNRRDVPMIKYYIIDFGISSAFDESGKVIEYGMEDSSDAGDDSKKKLEPEVLEKIKAELRGLAPNVNFDDIGDPLPSVKREELPPFMVTGRDALDKEVPELSDEVPYDPFLVDIFTLGNVYKKAFMQKYSNVEFLSPLVDSLMQTNPKMRPSVDEAIQHFEGIISRMSRFQLCLPLISVEKPLGQYSVIVANSTARIREFWIIAADGIKKLTFLSFLRKRRRD